MAAKKIAFLLIVLGINCPIWAQENPLERLVSIEVANQPTAMVLKQVSEKAGFLLSYNATDIEEKKLISIAEKNQKVAQVYQKVLGVNYNFKASGRHVIITKKNESKEREKTPLLISGNIKNAFDKNAIAYASIVEVNSRSAVLSEQSGTFSMQIKKPSRDINYKLLISKKNYFDTVITIQNSTQKLNIELKPHVTIDELTPIEALRIQSFNENTFVQSLVPTSQQYFIENNSLFEQRKFQVSFVPGLSTNGRLNSLTENQISFNVLGGYALGLNGFELSGIFALTRKNVKGFQISGVFNINGGFTKGCQTAGFFNTTIGSVNGLQLAGFSNTVQDSMSGAQISGFFNFSKGITNGLQLAGFANVSADTTEGAQIAGFTNVSLKKTSALQLSGFANVSLKDVTAPQISGFMNVGNKVNGLQIAGLLNVAKNIKGVQIGLVNISDSIRGIPIGLFSFSRKGYHQLEVSYNDFVPYNILFRTGVNGFHNIFSASFYQGPTETYGIYGYGVGSRVPLSKKFSLGLDAKVNFLNRKNAWNDVPDMWAISSLYVGFKPVKWLEIFAAPAFHAYRYEKDVEWSERPNPTKNIAFREENSQAKFIGWTGFNFGIRFF
jgi:hypothetical protein